MLSGVWVKDSPLLEKLIFPDLTFIYILDIEQVPNLARLSLPQLETTGPTYDDTGAPASVGNASAPDIVFNGTPQLADIQFKNAMGFGSLAILDPGSGEYPAVDPISPFLYMLPVNFPNLTSLAWYESNPCSDLLFVRSIENMVLRLDPAVVCSISFGALEWVRQLILEGQLGPAPDRNSVLGGFDGEQVRVNDALKISFINASDNPLSSPFVFTSPPSINCVDIHSVINAAFTIPNLIEVRESFDFYTNSASGFNVSGITSVGNMSMIDNPETPMPVFERLERADNIHLRGHMDMSLGFNLFPSLKFVSGNVTVEAWNDDFDCSKLVSARGRHNQHSGV
ncbi:hypothetical protein F4780DRAFT_59379 [Xylariomycetidae sp. FL0641]|nr:hypothetical protein F4780DRAFT_59379 [Xylariomycetidae sp. FL0641]